MNMVHHLEEISANYHENLSKTGLEAGDGSTEFLSILQQLDSLSPILRRELIEFLSR